VLVILNQHGVSYWQGFDFAKKMQLAIFSKN
jgi:hypothetical protein